MKKVLGSTLALAVLLWAMTVPRQDPAMNVWWWRNQILLLTGLAMAGALIGAVYPGLKAARQDAIEALSYD